MHYFRELVWRRLRAGLPSPPAGYAYVVDSNGAYVVDANGAYVIASLT